MSGGGGERWVAPQNPLKCDHCHGGRWPRLLTYLLQTFSLGSILKLVKINRDEALRGACLKSTLLHYLKPFTYKEPDREREQEGEKNAIL